MEFGPPPLQGAEAAIDSDVSANAAAPSAETVVVAPHEELAIEALLAGLRPPQPLAPTPSCANAIAAPPQQKHADSQRQQVEMNRDRLVFDAACGGAGMWTTRVSRHDVDFVEERDDGWAASVSIVLSLLRRDASMEVHHMHDETGSGRVERAADADAAEQLALTRATTSARKRLAKRFAVALGQAALGAIEKAAWREATGSDAPPPAAARWRPAR